MLSVGADEERGLEKKRVSLGVPKVFELKKEKKRKLILSDSESEEDAMSPCRRAAPVAGQNGSGSLLEKRNDLERASCKVELKDKVMRLDTNKEKLKELESDKDELKFEEKMSLSSDATEQRREDGTAESGTDNKVVKELGSDKEELKFDKEMSSSSDVPKQRDESDIVESGTNKNLAKELGSDKEDLKFDKTMSLSSDVAKQKDAFGTAESVTDKNLVKELGSDKEELKFDEKMSLSSDVAKQSEESSAAESGTNKNLVKELGSDKEELKFDNEMSLSSVKQIEEGGTDEKQVAELGSHKGELQFDKMVASSDAVIQMDKDGTNESKVTERSDEELKFDKNKAMKSEAVKQMEEVAELGSPNGLKYVRKWATRLDMIKEWEEAGTKKKKSTELRSAKWELKFDKKAMSADFFKKREEAAEFRSHKGLKYEKKRALRLDTIRQWDEDTDKKKFTKLERRFDKKAMSSDEEEPIFEKKRSLSSAAVKKRGEGGTDKKKATERSDKDELRLNKNKGMKSDIIKQREVEFDKKRAMRSDIMKSDDKKKAAELGSEKEELKVYKKKAMGSDVVKQRQESGTDKKRVAEFGSESKTDRKRSTETPDTEISRKKIKTESSKVGQDQTKEIDEKKIHKLKDSSTCSVGVKGEEPEKVRIQREGEEQMKTSTPFVTANQKVAKHPSLSGGKQVLEKPSSIGSSGKRQLNTKKISSAEKHKSHEENSESESEITLADKHKSLKRKTDLKSSSKKTEVEVVRPSSVKPDALVKGESVSSSKKSLFSTKQNTENGGENRATVVRKLREQIKGILLSAGWKIDLRPRRGRDYEDQVYVPPTGGGGYWSITKAYDVFQGQSGCANDDKSKKSSKLSTGSSSSSVIPTEALNMLKRKVVNKRRRRVEDDETLGSRSKKLKGATKMKGLKNKRKESTGGVSGKKQTNSLAGSNAKGVDGFTAQNLRRVSGKSKKSQRGCALLVRDANQEADAEFDDYVPYIWKRTVLSWMIDLGVVPSNGKVKYMNKKQTHTMLEGRITRDGIHCSCCSKVLTVSKFEIHAGSKLHQPYENIFVQESGVSLLQCQLNAWEKQDSERQFFYNIEAEGEDPNDDTCGICGDGGDLMCCDGCPSTFHQSCLGIEVLPPGDWHCAYCTCRYCRVVSENSAQGNGVAVSPLLSCLQCEEKYHQECIPEADAISISSDKLHASFCGRSCKKVFRRLQKLLGAKNDLEAGFSWRLIRRLDKDTPRSPCALPQRAECNANVAVALAVMDECFLPIIDLRTGINLIYNVVNNCGSNINRLNYNGFYTFILERGDEIIAAASVRIHGTRLAEMPFIGTRNMYRRQGMCRRLLNGVESALCSLGVEKLIIPAISELKQTWTTVFGFKPLEFSQKQEVESINMLVFHSTGLLQKPLLENHSAEQQHLATDEADKVEPEIKHHDLLKVAAESSAVSSVSPDHACDVAIVHSKHEVNDIEPSFPALHGCVHSTFNVAPESLNVLHGSKFQNQEYKPPENADSEAVCHEEPVEGDKFKDCFLIVPRIKSPCKGTVHNHHAIENEAKCVSPAATSSTLQDADAAHRCRSDVTSTSSSSFPADHFIRAGECIAVGNHDMKDQITTLQPKLNALCDNSGPLNVDSNSAIVSSSGIKSCEISGVSPGDLTVGDEVISDVPVEPNNACSVVASDTGISKDELAVVKPAHAFGPSSHCASEVATKSLENGSSTNGSTDASIL